LIESVIHGVIHGVWIIRPTGDPSSVWDLLVPRCVLHRFHGRALYRQGLGRRTSL